MTKQTSIWLVYSFDNVLILREIIFILMYHLKMREKHPCIFIIIIQVKYILWKHKLLKVYSSINIIYNTHEWNLSLWIFCMLLLDIYTSYKCINTYWNFFHILIYTKADGQLYCPRAIQAAWVVPRKTRAEDHSAEIWHGTTTLCCRTKGFSCKAELWDVFLYQKGIAITLSLQKACKGIPFDKI